MSPKPVIVVFSFQPPFCNFRAIDCYLVPIRDLARTGKQTTEEAVLELFPDPDIKIKKIIKHPDERDIDRAVQLQEINAIIGANI